VKIKIQAASYKLQATSVKLRAEREKDARAVICVRRLAWVIHLLLAVNGLFAVANGQRCGVI
jgi:hypothetical protein